MAQPDQLFIQLLIGNQLQTFNIPRELEEYYRTAAAAINQRFNTYQQKFPGKNYADYMYTVLLDFALQITMTQSANDTAPFVEAIKSLNEDLDAVLPTKHDPK